MSANIEIQKMSARLKSLQDEQSQIQGELKQIQSQLTELGITGDLSLDLWLKDKKEELENMKSTQEMLIKDIWEMLP